MTVRDDFKVDFNKSPRIVEVAAPATAATAQDIIDTLRDIENDLMGMSYPHLVDAAGKEDLGGSVKVGITLTLRNAVVKFESRTTPKESGTATSTGETTLEDTAAHFVTNGVEPGAIIINFDDYSVAEVLTVESEILLTHTALKGGTDNDWTVGDTYRVYNTVQCDMSGGNIVAVDDDNNPISPVYPSAFTQVVKTSSSSATLQELAMIQYASFNGGVWVDAGGDYRGTAFPLGTPQMPVNNTADAMAIANERGFNTIYVLGDLTLDTGLDYRQMNFIGESMTRTAITISADAQVEACEFSDATVLGVLDGNARLKNCRVLDLNYIYGVIEQCLLGPGTIVLGGGNDAYILDCWSGGTDSVDAPVIDMGGSGQNCALRNFNGGVSFKNMTGSNTLVVDLNSGAVELQSTVQSSAVILVRGIGTLVDNSSGASVTADTLINTAQVSAAVWDEPRVDHVEDGTFGKVSEWAGGGTADIDYDQVAKAASDGNMWFEMVPAAAEVPARKVAVGRVDYEILKIKNKDAADWSAPVATYYRYYHYAALGDINPIHIGPEVLP